jgi:predicted transcriptional regulator
MTHLGKLIWWGLLKTGMTRKELADTLEVTPVSVSRWLRKQGDNLVS